MISTNDIHALPTIMARKSMRYFASQVFPNFEQSGFQNQYYNVLDLFARGTIKRLIVTIPPQHGKSLGSSQLLPAYMLGLNPDLRIAVASYAFGLAAKFSKNTQRTMLSDDYRRIFPYSRLKENADHSAAASYSQTSEFFEIVGKSGSVMSVGRGGGLTGNRVDVMIIDDLYKDAEEGNSPVVRDAAWDWYTSVAKTRLHNDSQELIVFTRWHEDDLIGRIEAVEDVVELESLDQIANDFKGWYKLNFEAIKESDPTEIDPRQYGAPLWDKTHNLESLESKRKLDRHKFDCLYQGRPSSQEGLLYGADFQTYDNLPSTTKIANYTDTADMGEDRLCSICYRVGVDRKIYVTDVLYTPEPMEVTEPATAAMLIRNDVRVAKIESNNGGRGFARNVAKLCPAVKIEPLVQSANKEARVLTNAATVLQNVIMPNDWRLRWPSFYGDVTSYKRVFRANRFHDAPDVLTGIVEVECRMKRLVII